jgi:hypothetical protein
MQYAAGATRIAGSREAYAVFGPTFICRPSTCSTANALAINSLRIDLVGFSDKNQCYPARISSTMWLPVSYEAIGGWQNEH